MKYTSNYNLKKPDGTDVVNIEDFNSNADIIDTELNKKANTTTVNNKVDKVTGKGLSTNDYSDTEKQKVADSKTNLESHLAESATTSKKGHVQVGSNVNVSNGVISVPNASTNTRGAVQLSTSTTSTSTSLAATPSAVRLAMNRANEAFTSASDGKSKIATAITGKGVSTRSSDTFTKMASNIGNISTGKKWASGVVVGYEKTDVSGLGFQPSLVILMGVSFLGTSNPRNFQLFDDSGLIQETDKYLVVNDATNSLRSRRRGANSKINSDGFTFYSYGSETTYNWIAFG